MKSNSNRNVNSNKKPKEKKQYQKQQKQQKQQLVEQWLEDDMEVGELPPHWSSFLKESREEEEEKHFKKEKCNGRSRVAKKTGLNPFLHHWEKVKTMPISPTLAPLPLTTSISTHLTNSTPPHPPNYTPPHPSNYFPIHPLPPRHTQPGKRGRKRRRKVADLQGRRHLPRKRRELEKDLSTQKKALLDLLFKLVEHPNNFPKAPGVISCIIDTGSYLKVWTRLFEAIDTFSDISMAQISTHDLKKLYRFCSRRVPVLLHPLLYRVLKQYPTNIDRIVLDGRMMSQMGTGNWDNPSRSLPPQICNQSLFKESILKRCLLSYPT